ncbi:hypothetical protein C9439_04100 [archaeon SCG-AAA382B04]|nr:hypothetical protein C9439_04100 [archaeon SCG-AAA382B04]
MGNYAFPPNLSHAFGQQGTVASWEEWIREQNRSHILTHNGSLIPTGCSTQPLHSYSLKEVSGLPILYIYSTYAPLDAGPGAFSLFPQGGVGLLFVQGQTPNQLPVIFIYSLKQLKCC